MPASRGQSAEQKRHANLILRRLRQAYPDARCSLDYRTPLQLLVATILSAQCTDERVNRVTPALFARYPTARDFTEAVPEELEEMIRSTGFFRNKARAIQQACHVLVERHGGEVPADLDALVELAGVGRKTANVVLGNAFGMATGVVVDTHVARLAQRMGLSRHRDPEKIEQDLMSLFPRTAWIALSHRLIQHGRNICTARSPRCSTCTLGEICPRFGL